MDVSSPSLSTRTFDHAILAVRDLDHAGATWRALGFQVLPRMRHLVSGSANRIVQLAAGYIELLGDLEQLRNPAYRELYLGRLAFGEGVANLCFSSGDLERDRAAIVDQGIAVGEIGSARRSVVMPDGRSETTDSDFFYPVHPGHPYAAPFLAIHRRPETIAIPAYQRHANTAWGVVGVTQYSTRPEEDAAFFAAIAGTQPEAIDGGARVTLRDGCAIELLRGSALGARYGTALPALDATSGGYGVGLTIAVQSLDACRAAIATDIAAKIVTSHDRLKIPADYATNCFISFVARGPA